MADIQWTASQLDAFTNPCGPILVSAAAGSGKTMVLVQRLMQRVCDPISPCNVDDFLIITFTKKAAAELRGRIAKELSARLAAAPDNHHLQRQLTRIYLAKICTIDSFCSDLIREYAYLLDIPADFRMAEEAECDRLRTDAVEQLLETRYQSISENPDLKALADTLGEGRDDRKLGTLILRVYSLSQCRLYPSQWLRACTESLEVGGCADAAQTIWGSALIEDFKRQLAAQIRSMQAMLCKIGTEKTLEKYREDYQLIISVMERLLSFGLWEDLHRFSVSFQGFQRMPQVRKCPDKELQECIKALRKDTVSRIISNLSTFSLPSSEVLAEQACSSGALRALFRLVEEFSELYCKEKRRLHLMDFNDLEHYAVRLLLRPSDLKPTQTAVEVSGRFTEIMIDEYQDTNEVQDQLFNAISRGGKNRFMVGDVKQSIYRFRLADPSIFLKKYVSYPLAGEAETGTAQKILLSDNFRSGKPVVDAVNDVFRSCMSPLVGEMEYSDQEALREHADKRPLPDPAVELHCISTRQPDNAPSPDKQKVEAAYVADRIRRLLDDKSKINGKDGLCVVEPKDIVILLRSTKNAAGVFTDALQRLGIPCRSDRGESIFDSPELETMVSLLQVLDNAHRDIPLASVLLSPVFGITADLLAKARLADGDCDLMDALQLAAPSEPALSQALEALARLRSLAAELSVHELLEQIEHTLAFESIYAARPGGEVSVQRLRQFNALAAAFDEGGKKGLSRFLHYLDSLIERGVSLPESGASNAVTIMSIHKSKGLEFPVVFLSDLSKQFNIDDLKQSVLFDETLGVGSKIYDLQTRVKYNSIAWSAIGKKSRNALLSEEMRVLYVAMTRAKDRLIMTYCSERLNTRLTKLISRISSPLDPMVVSSASCIGDWILAAALLRTEAGELFAQVGSSCCSSVSSEPWLIRYVEAGASDQDPVVRTSFQASEQRMVDPDAFVRAYCFRYPFRSAVSLPKKITATQLKGRKLDEEAADGRPVRAPGTIRLQRASLIHGEKPLTAAQRGTAIHLAMQYLDFSKTDSLDDLRSELERLVRQAFLTPQQAEAVDPAKLLAVFEGPVGKMIRTADQVIREFKFSVLVPAETYFPNAGDEPLLLQGVTDCCLIKDNELTVIDFKTDRIRPGQEKEAGEKYLPQLHAYGDALSRIFELPVRQKLLYFFSTNGILSV